MIDFWILSKFVFDRNYVTFSIFVRDQTTKSGWQFFVIFISVLFDEIKDSLMVIECNQSI
jgi:hypothetical protein